MLWSEAHIHVSSDPTSPEKRERNKLPKQNFTSAGSNTTCMHPYLNNDKVQHEKNHFTNH